MRADPSLATLIEGVKRFIDQTAGPGLTGHDKFHARVASNTLAIVLRELEQRSDAEALERQRLISLIDAPEGSGIETLNKILCEKISSGAYTTHTPGLLTHLKSTVIDQLNIDQPTYSGIKTALEREE